MGTAHMSGHSPAAVDQYDGSNRKQSQPAQHHQSEIQPRRMSNGQREINDMLFTARHEAGRDNVVAGLMKLEGLAKDPVIQLLDADFSGLTGNAHGLKPTVRADEEFDLAVIRRSSFRVGDVETDPARFLCSGESGEHHIIGRKVTNSDLTLDTRRGVGILVQLVGRPAQHMMRRGRSAREHDHRQHRQP